MAEYPQVDDHQRAPIKAPLVLMVEQPDLLVQRGPPVLRTRLLLLPPSGRRRGPASLGRREPLAQRDGVPSEVLLWNTQNITGGEHFTANIYPSLLK